METLTVVIAVRDEELMLPGCLRRVGWADEAIVVVDDRTADRSETIAKDFGARVLRSEFKSFSDIKNIGINAAQSDWILVVDADERVSRLLASELHVALRGQFDAYRLEIANYFYGHRMRYGGWQERPIRLFKAGIASYEGDIHEVLRFNIVQPGIGLLSTPLDHFSHRSILDNLAKTAVFGDVQARAMIKMGVRPITPRRLYWVVLRELLNRLVLKQGFRDGVPGVIESLYQPLSLLSVNARLWELQQEPKIDASYKAMEDSTW